MNRSQVAFTQRVNIMSREDVLRSIKESENKASAKLEKARSDAAEIANKARAEAAELVASGRADADAEARALLDDARASAGEEADGVRKEGEAALADIHERGGKNRSDAVTSVLDAFRG